MMFNSMMNNNGMCMNNMPMSMNNNGMGMNNMPMSMNNIGMGMNNMPMSMNNNGMCINNNGIGMNNMGMNNMNMNNLNMGMNNMGIGMNNINMNNMNMGMNNMGMGMNNMNMNNMAMMKKQNMDINCMYNNNQSNSNNSNRISPVNNINNIGNIVRESEPKDLIPRSKETKTVDVYRDIKKLNKLNIVIQASSGMTVMLPSPPDISIAELFKNYINKINLPSSVLDKDITFIYKTNALNPYDKNPVNSLFNDNSLVLAIDSQNIIAA